MKLNLDCIRDILICMEKQPLNEELAFEDLVDALAPPYTSDIIEYTCLKLKEAGFIRARTLSDCFSEDVVSVIDITFSGHQFLANIRSEKTWHKVKHIAGKIGSTSIDSIMQIATNVAAELIKTYFGRSSPIS